MSATLAALPIAGLLVLMLGLRWSSAAAGIASLVAALGIALTAFDYGAGALGRGRAVLGVFAEAGFSALSIAWILLPALAIYQLQRRTGALEVLQNAIRRVTHEPAIVALLIAWFFALFLEGAAGFGTPVALAAPFLVSAGFKPIQAVTLALIGHAAGVAFGAIGTPIQAQVTATGLDPRELARAAGIYVAVIGWVIPVAMMIVVRRGAEPGTGSGRGVWGWTAIAAALFAVPYYVVARWLGPELPTLAGGLLGGLGFALLWQLQAGRPRDTAPASIATSRVIIAAAPYLLLIVLVLATRLIPPVRAALGVRWTWTLFGQFEGTLQLLQHPGSLLLASLLLGAAVQRASLRTTGDALATALRQLGPVVLALVAVLALSRLMVHAGMIRSLAEAAARGAGPVWPVLAPFVGLLGSFVTGSATSSNILFTEFQAATAAQADLAIPRTLGAQSFGAATGNMIAPMNVVAGAATVGLVGREGEILRTTLAICLGYTLLGGLLTWWLA
ncbi:MAG: L-lactate permease [Myxococcota bacterium]|nr:L-lactate permease [Myxococcota bacterium]